jgi:hypothetical protein
MSVSASLKDRSAALQVLPLGRKLPHGVTQLAGDAYPGVLWTNSIIPLFAQKRPSDKVLAPTRCGNGHELTPDNLVPAERGARWRCRQCGIERAAAWRRRHPTAA